MKHVVVIGGGFAGVRVARSLRKQSSISVTLVNEEADFRYCPALYRAATGFKMGTARLPLEWMLLDSSNASLVVNKAVSINPDKKLIKLQDGAVLDYDIAVLALGSVTTYFNIDGLHDHSYGIKTSEEVVELRQHLHSKIVAKEHVVENYVIVGAGPTGVELAGALGAYIKRIVKKHKARGHSVQIWLVEAGPRILPQMNKRAARAAHKNLEKLGVKLSVNTTVKGETIRSLKTSHGNIKTHTVIWTAGSSISPFYKENEEHFTFAPRGRIAVNKHLQARRNVYIAGDNASTAYSGTAMTAIHHGNFVAKDITAQINHTKRPTKYESTPISIVPAGRKWAVLQYRSVVLHGRAISWLRRIADYIGYSDVLGYGRAITIWSNSDRTEDACSVCRRGGRRKTSRRKRRHSK